MNQNTSNSLSSAMNQRFGIALPKNELSDSLASMRTAMTEILKNNQRPEEMVDVVAIDGRSTATILRFSAIAVVFRTKKQPNRLAYHVLILAGSDTPLEPRYVNLNPVNTMGLTQAKTEIINVPGDVYDELYMKTIDDYIAKQYPSVPQRVLANARVVPASFSFQDARAVQGLLNSAWRAAGVRFQEQDGVSELDMSKVATRPDQYQIRTVLTSSQDDDPVDLVGNPIRADFKTLFASNPTTNQSFSQSLNGDSATTFTQATGYVDVVQTSQMPFNQWGQPMAQQQFGMQRMPYAKYTPRVIITSLQSQQTEPTLAIYLLAMFGVFSLAEPNALLPFFDSSNFSGDGINTREVGALNIKANLENNPSGLGERLKTTATDFPPQQRVQFLNWVLEPGVHFSLDIEECGQDTWILEPFGQAASLDQELAAKGNMIVINAVDLLTGGHFSKFFPQGESVVMTGSERIINGKFPDRRGRVRSFSHIDYLHVINLEGESAPTQADLYASTYINQNEHPLQRLSTRFQLYKNLYPSIQLESITGYSQRVTLTPVFVNAFIEAMNAAKLNVANIPAGANLNLQQAPIYANLAQSSVNIGMHSVFNRANNVMGTGTNQRSGGRW